MADEFEIVRHLQISGLRVFVVTVNYRTPHMHRDYEINLILEGEIVLTCQNDSYTARKGQMLLLNPNQPHEFKTVSAGATALCLQISPKMLETKGPSTADVVFDTITPFDFFGGDEQQSIKHLFFELAESYTAKPPFYETLCIGLTNILLYRLLTRLPLHHATHEEQRSIRKKANRLNRILAYADENYRYKVRLSDIAQAEGLSLSYLSHFVKDNFNQTFQDYVNTLRLNQAKSLLLSGGKSLLDVSIEAGFSDPRYLYKAFVQNTGMSPDEYRRRNVSVEANPLARQSPHSSETYYTNEGTLEILQRLQADQPNQGHL